MWGKPGETQPTQTHSQPGNPAQGNPAPGNSPQAKPVQASPAPPTRPPAATPNPAANPGKPEGPTIFGKTMKIVGDVSCDEELFVDGELEGRLDLKNRLTIGPESKVNANIKAKEVIVFGSVRGNVEAEERIALRAGATIVGDIKTAGIIIEDGAYFKGGIDISKTDTPKANQKASQAAAGDKR
jgi:cytoskeletal protein CcmA (bactofilin family)